VRREVPAERGEEDRPEHGDAELNAFIRGRVLLELSEQEAIRRSGLSQTQWMETQVPYIESGRYPLLTRVVLDARAPHDPDRLKNDFDVGLERVLDGLATMLPE
jgi:hypothetical protein